MSFMSLIIKHLERLAEEARLASGTGFTRVGDSTRGHNNFNSVPALEGSTKVYIDGRGAVREGDMYLPHCAKRKGCHTPFGLTQKNVKVYADGRLMVVEGDKLSCGDTVRDGSSKVLCSR